MKRENTYTTQQIQELHNWNKYCGKHGAINLPFGDVNPTQIIWFLRGVNSDGGLGKTCIFDMLKNGKLLILII